MEFFNTNLSKQFQNKYCVDNYPSIQRAKNRVSYYYVFNSTNTNKNDLWKLLLYWGLNEIDTDSMMTRLNSFYQCKLATTSPSFALSTYPPLYS